MTELNAPGSPRLHPRRGGTRILALLVALALVTAACGDDDAETAGGADPDDGTPTATATPTPGADAPTIVATTSIWADVVSNLACDGLADVQTVIPIGGDPHSFEPSLADRATMEDAVLVVANGLLLEEGLADTIEAVESAGTPVFRVAEHVETIPYSFDGDGHDHAHEEDEGGDHAHEGEGEDHAHEEGDGDGQDHAHEEGEGGDHAHEDEGEDHAHEEGEGGDHAHDDEGGGDHAHDDEEGGDHAHDDEEGGDHAHSHEGDDPHVWFDPSRVLGVLDDLAEHLVDDAGLDADAVAACSEDYRAELSAVDAEIAEMVEAVPATDRKLVTSHDSLGYFADRYGFEVIGTVIPAPSGLAETNPGQLEELAVLIEETGVPAIFAETQHSTDDAEALADRVGDVEVVMLFTGTLGDPDSGAETYLGFLRTNAGLITSALS